MAYINARNPGGPGFEHHWRLYTFRYGALGQDTSKPSPFIGEKRGIFYMNNRAVNAT